MPSTGQVSVLVAFTDSLTSANELATIRDRVPSDNTVHMFAVILLVIAVTGVLVDRVPGPSWVLPVGAGTIALTTGIAGRSALTESADQLRNPLLFLLSAVPLAALLGELGLFRSLAALVDGGRRLALAMWILGALVTGLLNLDTSVVLLTPLAVELARTRATDEAAYAFSPVLLASLASSFLPVSNLTNLIAAERWNLDATSFSTHMALPTLAGVMVGWPLLARRFPPTRVIPVRQTPNKRALRIGLPIIGALTIGFTVGDRFGLPAWTVATAADVLLALLLRRAPWRALPVGTAVMVLSIGVLSVAATPHLGLDSVLRGSGVVAHARVVLVCAVLAALINNLPAALIAFATVSPSLRWAAILGVNLGPLLTLHGSLAGLLWQESLHRLGVPMTSRRYQSVSWRAGVPAALIATAVLAVTVG